MSTSIPQTTAHDRALGVRFGAEGRAAHARLIDEYLSTLALPPDDMWWAFADRADPVAVYDGDQLVGLAAIDADGELHRCYLRSGHEQYGPSIIDLLAEQRPVTSMIAATTDPVALTALLPRARSATPVALLYHHETDPVGKVLDGLRTADAADAASAVTFVADSTDGPLAFIEAYVSERIDRQEFFVHEIDGEIAGVGERRVARPGRGHAHLGIIVHHRHRGRGLGGALMNTLVVMCERERRTPLCSTEPDNAAARRSIHRAGFRSRHTIFRLKPVSRDAGE